MAFVFTPHPDDLEMLLRIRRYLIGYRHTNGWTQEELSARINGSKYSASDLEKGGFDWHLSRLQAWPVPFGLRLHVTPCFTQPMETSEMLFEAIEADPLVSTYAAMMMEQRSQWQTWQRLYLCAYLVKARELQGITHPQLGRRLAIAASSVSSWERGTENMRLLRLLNHARALGGRIMLEVA